MSTLEQMRANTRVDLIIDPNGDIFGDTAIDRYLNEFIGVVYSWEQLDFEEVTGDFTLVASTATYDLDSELTNYGRIKSLRLDGKTTLLKEVPQTEFNDFENGRDLTQTGEPGWYYFYGDNTIGLYPVPNGDITTIHARFDRSEPTLTSSESPAFDSRWHHVPELYARWKCFSTVPGHESTAKEAKLEFLTEQAKMKEDVYLRDNNGYRWKQYNPTVWPV